MSHDVSTMMIGSLLDSGSISPRVTATDKRQVISVIAEIAARCWGVKAPRVFDALMEREASGATGVGHGVAIPHAQIEGLDRLRGVFLRLNPAVEYGSVDDEPVNLVFALLAPVGAGSEQLRAMARIARSLRQGDLRSQLRQAGGADAIRILFSGETRSSAA